MELRNKSLMQDEGGGDGVGGKWNMMFVYHIVLCSMIRKGTKEELDGRSEAGERRGLMVSRSSIE